MAIKHNLFEERVVLTEDHRYVHNNGNHFIGFSSFYENCLFKGFNSSAAAFSTSKSRIKAGDIVSAADVQNEWNAKRDLGVRYDSAIQLFLAEKRILNENEDIAELVISACAEYNEYFRTFTQVTVFNEEFNIAGAIDAACLTSAQKTGLFELSDIKVFEKDDLHKHGGWMNGPVAHLSATKFNKITLQLSFYAYQLEMLTGKKCKKMFIHQLHHETKTHKKVYVPYLKNDIILCLNHYKEKILSLAKYTEPDYGESVL